MTYWTVAESPCSVLSFLIKIGRESWVSRWHLVAELFWRALCVVLESEYFVQCCWTFALTRETVMSWTFWAGECILRVWQHTSALQPCKCPICRRPITLLIPSEVPTTSPEERTAEEIMSDIAKYNRIFGGGVVSLIQVCVDMSPPKLSIPCVTEN
jgi:hypothetical protein